MPQSFLCQAESRQNTHLETDASAGSKKPGALDFLIPRLESKPLPLEEFWCIFKNMVLMDPRGNKGTKTNYLKRLVCVDRQYTVSGLAQTRFHTGVIKVWAPRHCVGKATFHFYFSCDSYWDARMIQYENKISLCTITFSFSKLKSYHINRNHMKGDLLLAI